MATEARLRSWEKYKKANTRMYGFRFHNRNDAKIIEKLDSIQGSRTEYIRQLILRDIGEAK